jgi:hemerythrin superfamily protein
MDALTLLTEQHKEVDELIAELEGSRKSRKKEERFKELADKLAAHATMEEQLFYPAVKAKQTKEILLESTEEHLAIKRVLADMLRLDVNEDQFEAKLAVMKHQIEHHAHEEEEKMLFPKVRKLMSKDELEALGGEMTALFEKLLEDEPRKDVPSETGRAAPL